MRWRSWFQLAFGPTESRRWNGFDARSEACGHRSDGTHRIHACGCARLSATAKVCISLPGRRDLCSEYKFWAVRQAIFSVPKSARRNQRTATEPTALSAWACPQPDNKRSTIAHAHLKASRTPVRRERGRVSQPLTPRVKSVMPNTSISIRVDSVFDNSFCTPAVHFWWLLLK
jgi:hypothetical protein